MSLELETKIEQLSRANSELKNLMEVIDVGILFIDRHLYIKHYTKKVTDIFKLNSSDKGRSIKNVRHILDYDSLMNDLSYVIESQNDIKKTVYDKKNDRWYIMRQRPYLSIEDKIYGIVITFTEITELKKTEEKLEEKRHQETLATLGMYALEHLNLDSIMNRAIQQICLLLGIDYALVLILDKNNNTLHVKAHTGWEPQNNIKKGVENNIKWDVGFAFRAKQPVIVTNFDEEERFSLSPFMDGLDIVSGVHIKITGSEENYGILSMYFRKAHNLTKHEMNFVQIVANLVGMSIERIEAKKNLEEKNRQIEEEIKKSRQYQHEILNNSLIERWQIGGFLHDNLAQMLASIKILLIDIGNKLPEGQTDISRKIQELNSYVDDGLSSIRDLTHDIIPVDIEEDGVKHAFRFLIRQSQKFHNIQCKLKFDDIIDKIRDRTVATNVYHVVQEAIKNAAVHGKAKNIELIAEESNGNMILRIIDDGIGMPKSPKIDLSKGLRIMKYRIELLGGTFNIEGASGSGTIVTCTLPLSAHIQKSE